MMMKKNRNGRQVRERHTKRQNDKKHNKQQKIEDEQRKKGKNF